MSPMPSSRQSFCNLGVPTPKQGHPTAAFEVAQAVRVADTAGWVCHAVSTLTTHICGLWGYKKAVLSMSGRTKLILSPSQCHQLVTRGTFKTEQGHTISRVMAPASQSPNSTSAAGTGYAGATPPVMASNPSRKTLERSWSGPSSPCIWSLQSGR